MNIAEILKNSNLSITESRSRILALFCDANGALVHADIEKSIAPNFDRVTVYRTLQTFVEKGIIHQIPTTDNTILYALCKHDCAAGHHKDEHVHFVCNICNKTICLDNILVPEVKLPTKFKKSDAAMVVSGVCAYCQ